MASFRTRSCGSGEGDGSWGALPEGLLDVKGVQELCEQESGWGPGATSTSCSPSHLLWLQLSPQGSGSCHPGRVLSGAGAGRLWRQKPQQVYVPAAAALAPGQVPCLAHIHPLPFGPERLSMCMRLLRSGDINMLYSQLLGVVGDAAAIAPLHR